jgi:molybdenum cofactor sulfurtransferase
LIEEHCFRLARYLYQSLAALKHYNGKPLAVLYHDTQFEIKNSQGPIVNFNLNRSNGTYIGFSEVNFFNNSCLEIIFLSLQVMHLCNLFNVHLRTGCFCNPGACQRHLELSLEELEEHFEVIIEDPFYFALNIYCSSVRLATCVVTQSTS